MRQYPVCSYKQACIYYAHLSFMGVSSQCRYRSDHVQNGVLVCAQLLSAKGPRQACKIRDHQGSTNRPQPKGPREALDISTLGRIQHKQAGSRQNEGPLRDHCFLVSNPRAGADWGCRFSGTLVFRQNVRPLEDYLGRTSLGGHPGGLH